MAHLSFLSLVVAAAAVLALSHRCDAFAPSTKIIQTCPSSHHRAIRTIGTNNHNCDGAVFRSSVRSIVLKNAEEDETSTAVAEEKPAKEPLTLEEKMKSWEATEEEIRAASLGGVVPNLGGGDRTDGFDLTLYILFPFIVLSGLAFAFFPFIMGNLDLSDVGPPPTV